MREDRGLNLGGGRPRTVAVAGFLAIGAGAAVALVGAPLLVVMATFVGIGSLLLIRSSARMWLAVLACVVAFDGVVKLLFWPAVWPQLIAPGALCCVYLRARRLRSDHAWLSSATVPIAALAALLLLGLLSMLAHDRASPIAGAVGIYTWVAFTPLAWVGATLLAERRHLERAVQVVLLLTLPIGASAAVQYLLGDDWYASLGPGFAQATFGVAGFSGDGVFRVNGTFSSAGHLGGFMIPMTFLSVAATTAGGSTATRRAGALGLMASLVTLFANNQRSWVVIIVVGIPVLFLLTRSGVEPGRWLRLTAITLAGLGTGAAVAGPALLDRVLTIAVDPIQVIFGNTLGDFGVLKLASIIDSGSILGNGPGTATIGARYFGPIWELTENYFANAYYELGPFGLAAIATVLLTVPLISLRAWEGESDAFMRAFIAATLVYQSSIVVLSITYSPLAYPPSALFFWTSSGIAAARLAAARRASRTETAASRTYPRASQPLPIGATAVRARVLPPTWSPSAEGDS
jgi:hypothetical protein